MTQTTESYMPYLVNNLKAVWVCPSHVRCMRSVREKHISVSYRDYAASQLLPPPSPRCCHSFLKAYWQIDVTRVVRRSRLELTRVHSHKLEVLPSLAVSFSQVPFWVRQSHHISKHRGQTQLFHLYRTKLDKYGKFTNSK